MRVLVLRPDDGAQRTAARLRVRGHEAICSPVMETIANRDPPPPGVFDGVIATSAQAFAFAEASALHQFSGLPLMCVGARTAEASREAGFANLRIEAPDAAKLAQKITQSPDGLKRLLYLAGRDRKPGLEQALASAGFDVAPWVVYEARAVTALREETAQALRAGAIDAALHFSRRSAATFCKLAVAASLEREARDLLHIAISADTSDGLSSLAPPRVRIAPSPDEAHMLDLLA